MLLLPYTFAIICIFWHCLLNCKSTFTTKLEKKKTFPPKRMQNAGNDHMKILDIACIMIAVSRSVRARLVLVSHAHAKCEPLSEPLLFCQLSNRRRTKLFRRNVFFSSFVVNVDLQFKSQSQKVSCMLFQVARESC